MASNNAGDNLFTNPCLDWMRSPINQASALATLAKFLDQKELSDRFNDIPIHKRAGFLVCLLYEVCGWLLDPQNGLEGLFRSGNWEHSYHGVRALLQGKPITPLQSNPSNQAIGRTNAVPTRDHEIHRAIGQGKRPLIEVDDDEPRNPSKRSCSAFKRVEPSRTNQPLRSQVMDPAPASSSSSTPKEDEVSLELTLGRPDHREDAKN